MALTEEELKLQLDILATKTSDNANMVYKTNATLNKGLNPDYFSGNNTKIVNAINSLAADASKVTTAATDVTIKVNSILLDTDATDNKPIWEHVQSLMGKPTIIEGLEDILTGNKQKEILGLDESDVGKYLTVGQDDEGHIIIKAIDAIINGGSGGGNTPGDIFWEDIKNKPAMANELAISEDKLCLMSEDGTMSSVDLTKDEDIDHILNELN